MWRRVAAGCLCAVVVVVVAGCGGRDPQPAGAPDSAASSLPLDVDPLTLVPDWVGRNHLTRNATKGAKLFAQAGCLFCHPYQGAGESNLGGPDLSAEAARRRGAAWQVRHLKCPACVHPGSSMPSFRGLGDVRLRQIAEFLEASKG